KVRELLQTGTLTALQELLRRTPEGVLEMMHIKGLGPKKIHTLWKELSIDSIEALAAACQSNRIAQQKGFGDKTQQKILEAISFRQEATGKYLYASIEAFALAFTERLRSAFPACRLELTGDFRRQLDIIDHLDWVTTIPAADLQAELAALELPQLSASTEELVYEAQGALPLRFHLTTEAAIGTIWFTRTCAPSFLQAFRSRTGFTGSEAYASEESLFAAYGLPPVPPPLREEGSVLQRNDAYERLLQPSEVKGLIHAHSTWSDGGHTLEAMAEALIEQGFEYLVISDHSKAAFYANGLDEARIRQQHREIDALNAKLAPFKIYKSIECDILGDGSLDYDDATLASFDLVIASIHSNLDMDEEKAMHRLLQAIANPYVTILGHMTGRLLLRRKGYPVNHKKIIEACSRNEVAIEINANPNRLDIGWQWVDAALQQGVLLSVNPDAHTIDEYANIKYGVLVGQKGGLTAERNLSSFSRVQFDAFLQERRRLRGI
ncbi:MAG TPA: helix-hairpin-helix domain-containing protein, partial [Chitinophagaceae bacterium]|nr:helix-hairpin-helix domain-containing protein [Chitinophagaceae bacterium]